MPITALCTSPLLAEADKIDEICSRISGRDSGQTRAGEGDGVGRHFSRGVLQHDVQRLEVGLRVNDLR